MMEAARTPETLVNFYQTTRRYNPKRQPSSYSPPQTSYPTTVNYSQNWINRPKLQTFMIPARLKKFEEIRHRTEVLSIISCRHNATPVSYPDQARSCASRWAGDPSDSAARARHTGRELTGVLMGSTQFVWR
jgi:hypothetical protein